MLGVFMRLIIPMAAVAAGGLYLKNVSSRSQQAAVLIRPVYYLLCLCFAAIAVREVLKWRRQVRKSAGDAGTREEDRAPEKKPLMGSAGELRVVAVCALGVAAYIAALKLVGFCLPTALFLFAGFLYMKERRIWLAALLAVVITAVVYLVFSVLLSVPLPRGFMGF